MYSIDNKKFVNKNKMLDKTELLDIEGFLMGSKGKVYKMKGNSVKDIRVVEKNLANPLVSKQVLKKYEKLIAYLTDLLVDDDDSGDTCREALNQIERFRVEIKTKYRKFLKQKELEMMSKQLLALQKAANERLLEIRESYLKYQNDNKRSK